MFAQNIAVTLFGWRLKRQRYGRRSDQNFDALMRSDRYSKQELSEFVIANFRDLVQHVLTTVPFYNEWAAKKGIELNDFHTIDDIKNFPIIEKEILRTRTSDFISEDFSGRNSIFPISSSGTSGKPITIFCDRNSRTYHYAFWRRLRFLFGLRIGARRAALFGRVIMRADQDKRPFWRLDRSQNILLMSSYHLSDKNLLEYYKALVRYKPEEVIGYPSSVYQISQFIVSKGLKPLVLKVVFLTAETLMPYQRETIEAAFDCPVINQYGCSEMAFFAAECERGSMHLHSEHGFLEVLDEHDSPVESGQLGVVVATGFVNRAMPLLRYRVGDKIAMSSKTCECGRSFAVIDTIEGRVDDVITTPDGRPIGRLDPVLKGRRGIIETQIAQTAFDRLEVRVVVERGFDANSIDELVSELRLRIGKEMKIDVVRTRDIPRGPSGKFTAVVREF